MSNKNCAFCEVEFKPRRKTSLFCSRSCAARFSAREKRRERGLPDEVFYDASGNWRPTISYCVCEMCGEMFTGKKRNARFCSNSCSSKHTNAERYKDIKKTEKVCLGCKKTWMANPSCGDKYCSKKCIYDSGVWQKAVIKPCKVCGERFSSTPKKKRVYCSFECSNLGRKKLSPRKCKNCGMKFMPHNKKHKHTCSRKCSSEYFKRDRSHMWSGGVADQRGRPYRRTDREKYAAKYEGEHRVIAGQIIGRKVARGETVMCIDGDNLNIEPENLFICPSSDFARIRFGSLEWPSESNLDQVAEAGYRQPPVSVVIHEWENNKRPHPYRKCSVTRHPHADEIIKRRLAGASIQELADAFGVKKSTMNDVVSQRL